MMFDRPEWIDRAVCRGADTAVFVPDHAGNQIRGRHCVTPPPEVLACCDRCPVTEDCLQHGIKTGSCGFFGGLYLRFGRPIPTSFPKSA